jgi:hypothetical protein
MCRGQPGQPKIAGVSKELSQSGLGSAISAIPA